MDPQKNGPTVSCYVEEVPFLGRAHINPMMCLCELLALRRKQDLLVTEEWFGFIGSDSLPENVRFAKIPDVIPSEIDRGVDQPAFYEAVLRNMRAPLDEEREEVRGMRRRAGEVSSLRRRRLGKAVHLLNILRPFKMTCVKVMQETR